MAGYEWKLHDENVRKMMELKKANPKFLNHILQKNEIILAFARSAYGGIQILELPMCGHCEKPGAWHTDDSCYCWICGKVTPKAMTLYEYLANELRLSEEDMKIILNLDNVLVIDGGLNETIRNNDN